MGNSFDLIIFIVIYFSINLLNILVIKSIILCTRINFIFQKYDGTQKFSQQDIHSAKATGFSAASDDYAERGIDLNEELIYNKPATFFMQVNSDALKESGIYKEDIVIVDRSLKPGNGKVIIAILHGDMLIRRYEKINNNIRLLADSQKLATISIDNTCEDFEVWGVVTYVIHKL